jgi:hypothetical protein
MSTYARRGVPPMTPVQSYTNYYPSHAGPSVVDYTSCQSTLPPLTYNSESTYALPSIHPSPSCIYPTPPTPSTKCNNVAPSLPAGYVLATPPSPVFGVEAPRQPVVEMDPPVKAKVDMNMARPGSDSSLAGHKTPIARHVGKYSCPPCHPPR